MTNTTKKTALTARGLNYRDRETNLKDGDCLELMNVSWRDGCWRGVSSLSAETTVTENPDGYRIVYKHPILDEGEYIAWYDRAISSTYRISCVRVTGGKVSLACPVVDLVNTVDIGSLRFSHFGAVLFLNYVSGGEWKELSFIFHENRYVPFNLRDIKPLNLFGISYSVTNPPWDISRYPANPVAEVTLQAGTAGTRNPVVESFRADYNTGEAVLAQSGYITGAVYLFAAYKLYDGTIVRNGDIRMLMPRPDDYRNGHRIFRHRDGNVYRYFFAQEGFTANLSVASELTAPLLDLPFVESIVFFATVPAPVYDFDAVFWNYDENHPRKETISMGSKFFDVVPGGSLIDRRNFEAAGKPFYQVAELDFRRQGNVRLDRSSFEGIESARMYVPNYSVHDTISSGSFDYNGFFHRYALKTSFYGGEVAASDQPVITLGGTTYHKVADSPSLKIMFVYTLGVDGRDVVVGCEKSAWHYALDESGEPAKEYQLMPNFFTYPDARARRVAVYLTKDGVNGHCLADYELRGAYANNCAYYYDTSGEHLMGYMVLERGKLDFTRKIPVLDGVLEEKNKMIVSDMANPFSFSPVNAYRLGEGFGTEIVDINIPADNLSDARFGDFPIYVFTTAGIYAMERSEGTALYGNSVLLNTDRVVAGSRTVVKSGNLFYLTGRGVGVLQGRAGTCLSEALHGRKGGESFLEYAREARLFLFDSYEELLVCREDRPYAYVWSLNGHAWSKRHFCGRYIGSALFVDGPAVYSLSRPEDRSRPLLGEVVFHPFSFDYDRAKSFEEVRADYTGDSMEVSVYGMDGEVPRLLKRGTDVRSFRRLPGTWRKVGLSLRGYFGTLTRIAVTYAVKYGR